MRVSLQIGPLRGVPGLLAIAAYRVVQECLNNAARHASARNVNISVVSADGELRLQVEDDGAGFRVEDGLRKRGSFGLAGMSERVSLLGGEFHVESRPGKGTRIRVRLPIRESEG